MASPTRQPTRSLKLRRWRSSAASLRPSLQIEYALLERTPEYELLPATRELGLGMTPWGPLKSGILLGNDTRENVGKVEGGRAQMVQNELKESTFALLDVVTKVAKEQDRTPACVALA